MFMVDDVAGEQVGPDVCSIAELYDDIARTLKRAFPTSIPVWVRGEVQKVYESSGHAYIDLVDADSAGDKAAPVLKVKAWRSMWGATKADLAANGIFLKAGMTVVLRGRIDFYKARAEVNFILDEIDVTALLGRLAKERAALIESLRVSGLLDAQRGRVMPVVPLRVGLVGSPGTEGFNDFLGQLERSGFGFAVTVVRATVQGPAAPAEVGLGIRTLADEGVDLICVVRGGGSKGDLAAFDAAEIAHAIATCEVPVWTGIGHTGDESVADLVAHTRHITPTACGQAVVTVVTGYWMAVVAHASRIGSRSLGVIEESLRQNDRTRVGLAAKARHEVDRHRREVAGCRQRLVALQEIAVVRARDDLESRSLRLTPMAGAHLERAATALAGRRQLLAAYDPARLLERGWSLTTDANGRVLRSIDQVAVGAMITTRLADGTITSTVDAQGASTTAKKGT